MVNVLEALPETETTAANGRFFNAHLLQRETELFYVTNADLFVGDTGVIMQAGQTEDGELVLAEDIGLEPDQEIVLMHTLVLGTGQRNNGMYTWQVRRSPYISRFSPDTIKERSTIGILELGRGIMSAYQHVIDQQGRHAATQEAEPVKMARRVRWLLGHKATGQAVELLRHKKTDAERSLSKFSVEGIPKLGKELYKKRLKDLKKTAKDKAFIDISLYSPI